LEQPLIAWTPQLAVGDPTVDAQHQRLMDLIARITDTHDARDALTMNAAVEYAATHFKAEEQLMNRLGYPAFPDHARLHRQLTQNLLGYVKKVGKGETDLRAFKQFMFKWVRDHIMVEDLKLARFLRTRTTTVER